METSSFRLTSEAILDEFLSWDPPYATQLGWHKYDELLPDWSGQSVTHQLERMAEIVYRLSKVDRATLSENELIDLDLATHLMNLRIFEIARLRMREKVSLAVRDIGDSLFFLFTRDRPALEERLQFIAARLEKVPDFIATAQRMVVKPYRLWNEIQCETGNRFPRFLRDIEEMGSSKSNDRDLNRRLRTACTDAASAIQDHNNWLRKEIIPSAIDVYAIGPQLYEEYLRAKGFGVTPIETLRIAEMHLEDVNRKKEEVSKMIVESGRPREALHVLRSDHPADSKAVLDGYKSSVIKAKKFVVQKSLATLPEGEQLSVIDTPYFMRHLLAYAAQFEPGRFDDDKKGIFLVTPADGDPSLLEEHSFTSITNTSVHEGYPGHHLHGVCMNNNPSLIRPLYQSSDFAEGWALYCEEMMLSQGYNDTPLGRLMILNDVAFRIARQICDVKVSTGTMSVEEAAQFISAQTETNMASATSEARAIMLSPTYFMSYFTGKLGVLQMREDVEKAMGEKFTLRFFHDSLIYSGCMPMSYMRRAMAVKMKEEHGIALDEPRETLSEFAERVLRAN